MSLTTEQIFDGIAPQYATSPAKAVYLEIADERTAPASVCGWSEQRRRHAVALRAAHVMTMSQDPSFALGGGCGVSKKREGDLQVDYRVTAAKTYDQFPDLAQTAYGTELIGLIRATMMPIGVTGLRSCATLNHHGGW